MTVLSKNIFVFGSNLAGRHGAGSAKEARDKYGAEYGVGVGRTGDAYAIPTKDRDLKTLPIAHIKVHVSAFLVYAGRNRHLNFTVVAIGCGLAGYSPADIAPLFERAPRNVSLPESFNRILGARR